MAAAQKLDWLKDFDILNSGTSQLRTVALVSGNAQGAMLTQPFDIYATRQGMHILARGSEVLHDWISNGIAVNPTWAAAHRPQLVASASSATPSRTVTLTRPKPRRSSAAPALSSIMDLSFVRDMRNAK